MTDLQQFSAELAAAYQAQQARIEGERLTLEFGSSSRQRLDSGRRPIEESPLFGGDAQQDLFGEVG